MSWQNLREILFYATLSRVGGGEVLIQLKKPMADNLENMVVLQQKGLLKKLGMRVEILLP